MRLTRTRPATRVFTVGALVAGLAVPLAALAVPAQAATYDTTLVARATDGTPATGNSHSASVSANGQFVAFASNADNLSDQDDNAYVNAYVRDLVNGTTTLVSRASDGPANGNSFQPSISSDGDHVAFVSDADNLSDQDDDAYTNVYVRDLVAGTTTVVSRTDGTTGGAANGDSSQPSISANGTRVAFTSVAENLSGQDTNECSSWGEPYPCANYFVRDLTAGSTTYVAQEGDSCAASISANGLFVAIGTGNGEVSGPVQVVDLQTGARTYASREDGPSGAVVEGFCPSISADGSRVAFYSGAPDLSAENNDSVQNVYVRDLQTGATRLVSRADGATGIGANKAARSARISGDGLSVAFESEATNLSPSDTNQHNDIFVRNLKTDETTYASRASGVSGDASDGPSWNSSLSADGRVVTFQSDAKNLSADDGELTRDAYVRELGASAPEPPGLPDLSVSMWVTNTSPYVGSEVTFTVTLSNDGIGGATGVALTDRLPAGLTFVSAAPSQGSYTADSGAWSVGSVASGATATLRLVARVDAVGSMVNTAEVSAADQADPDSTPGNADRTEDDQTSVGVNGSEPPPRADLSVAMTASDPSPTTGSEVTLSVTVSNAGWSEATGVAVWDQLPTGLTFVSATASQGTYRTDVDVWSVGRLAAGSTATLELVVKPTAGGALTNTAEVSTADVPDPDSQPGNHNAAEDDQASVTITAAQPVCTSATVTAAADSWVGQNAPSSNYGADAALKVRSKSSANARTLAKFSLPAVPTGCTVTSAKLRLYAGTAATGRTLRAYAAAAPWSENAVTWNNRPSTTGTAATTSSAAGWVQWSVTTQVNGMYSGTNNGFLIRDTYESGSGPEQRFRSRESTTNLPELIVTFGPS